MRKPPTDIPIEDRIEIQELTYLYNLYGDTKQFARKPELFTEDCVHDESVLGIPIAYGRRGLKDFYIRADDTAGPMIHIVTNHMICAYTGSRASGLCYVWCEGSTRTGQRICVLGYYDDEYEKVDGRWLFQSRKLVALVPTIGLPTEGGVDHEKMLKPRNLF